MTTVVLFLLFLAVPVAQLSLTNGRSEAGAVTHKWLTTLLTRASNPRCSLFFFIDGSIFATIVFTDFMDQFRDPCGVGLFEVAVDGQDANVTQAQLSRVVDEARQLRQVSWCVTVVVVSDDPAFLATFAEWSLKGHLLVWSTRLLAVTHLPLPDLRYIHRTFSRMNAMVVIVEDAPETLKCNVYIHLPYSSPEDRAMRLAFWTPQRGLTLNTHLPLFPDKYSKFLHRPILAVAAEYIHVQKSAQGQKSHMMDYLSQGLNFTYKYVHPADGTFGSEQDDGSWSGMVGMVIREEADFSVGFFSLSASRAEVLDFTWPVSITYSRILAGLGRPELDPWGFLLPLAPLVWAFILVSLLLLPAAMFILSLCCSMKDTDQWVWVTDGFTLLRILLQQDTSVPDNWWWRRVVVAGWMVGALVLIRSYSGNLMSVLAVQYIKQPYQTLRDVLDEPSTTMIVQINTTNVQYFRSVESGIFREVAELEQKGLIKFQKLSEFFHSMDTLVRHGHHVLFNIEIVISMIIGRDFSKSGRCDYYSSRERYLPVVLSLIGQKDSPLVPELSKKIWSMTESGLYNKWFDLGVPNSTACTYPPTNITQSASFSLAHFWGVFVVLAVGHSFSLLVICLELLLHHFLACDIHHSPGQLSSSLTAFPH